VSSAEAKIGGGELAAVLWLADGPGRAATRHAKGRDSGVTHLAVVASTATQAAIGSDFLRGLESLQQVVFVLPGVRSVGDAWLAECDLLASVPFEGLGALASVGDNWLSFCTSLTSVSFEGLGALASVGDYWFCDCTSLVSVSFEGLGALASVGDDWLSFCTSLTRSSLGLGALRALLEHRLAVLGNE
jgi:hypothetical protein